MKRKKNILYYPPEELKLLQERKLYNFINNQIYPFSPYYRKLFKRHKINPTKIKTKEDLQRVPFTSKKDIIDVIRNNPSEGALEFLLQPRKENINKRQLIQFSIIKLFKGAGYLKEKLESQYRPIFLTATAGTTSTPIPFLYTAYDLDNLALYGHRIVEILNIKREDKAMNVFPYAPHLAFWQTVFAGFSAKVFIISTGGGRTVGTKGNLRTLFKVKPKFLIGTPDYVYHLIKMADDQERDLSFIKRIVLGAGRVPQGFKQKLAYILQRRGAEDVKIFGTYGFTEARCAWVECPTSLEVSSGYHTYPDKEIFEIIDPKSGEVKKEGEDGELVYTCIDARGSCVIRYRTGDFVKGGIIYAPCPYCGRTVPRISSDIVRLSNLRNIQLSKIKGTLVNLNDIEHFLDNNLDIENWQLEITKHNSDPYEVDELNLYVNLKEEVDKERFIDKINEGAKTQLEIRFNRIEFVSSEEIKRRIDIEKAVKAKRIIDKRRQL